MTSGEFIIFINQTPEIERSNSNEQMVNNLIHVLELYLNISVSAVLSESYDDLTSIRSQYRLCKEAMKVRFYFISPSLLKLSEIKLDHVSLSSNYIHWANEIREAWEEHNLEKADELITSIVNMAKKMYFDPDELKKFFITLFDNMIKTILSSKKQQELMLDKIDLLHGEMSESTNKVVISIENVDEFNEWVKKKINHLFSVSFEIRSKHYRKEVNKVIEIVKKRIETKITLNQLAHELNMSETHLCRIFKQDTGKSIINYIIDYKLSKAAEMLKNTDLQIKEIASEIGIHDPFYFNRSFKKIYGVSPSQFRKKNRYKNKQR
jgi:two-component system response regulator YesN